MIWPAISILTSSTPYCVRVCCSNRPIGGQESRPLLLLSVLHGWGEVISTALERGREMSDQYAGWGSRAKCHALAAASFYFSTWHFKSKIDACECCVSFDCTVASSAVADAYVSAQSLWYVVCVFVVGYKTVRLHAAVICMLLLYIF